MYVIYETATGKLKGASALPIVNIDPDVYSLKEVEGPHRIWNEQTLQFDPFPTPPKILRKIEFLDLFTDGELTTIIEAAKTVPGVNLFLKKLELADEVSLSSTRTIAGITALRSGGYLTLARAQAILRGDNV